MDTIVIATIKSWNIDNAHHLINTLYNAYKVIIIEKKEDLTLDKMVKYKPKYIFFPHWSWIIPEEIYTNFECVVFHMTDLPYGRGGSPLQNLILNKKYETKISAIKVEKNIDAGKIYLKENFYIGIGSADENFIRISEIVFSKMIPYILEKNPVPYEQKGNVVFFERRRPEESDILAFNFTTITDLYDFIRMLDGEGYPNAFIKLGSFKILFSDITQKNKKLTGRFEIIENEK